MFTEWHPKHSSNLPVDRNDDIPTRHHIAARNAIAQHRGCSPPTRKNGLLGNAIQAPKTPTTDNDSGSKSTAIFPSGDCPFSFLIAPKVNTAWEQQRERHLFGTRPAE
jgi:hypothetical protein